MPDRDDLILLVTAGRSDLQFLVPRVEPTREEINSAAQAGRNAFDPMRIAAPRMLRVSVETKARALHESLLRGTLGHVVSFEPRLAADVDKGGEAGCFLDDEDILVQDADGKDRVPCYVETPEGDKRYVLVAPKLARPLEVIDERIARSAGRLVAALILNTNRDGDDNEPIAVGPLLARAIAAKYGLAVADTAVQPADASSVWQAGWMDYLVGRERLEDPGPTGMNPAVIRRIDRVLAMLARRHPCAQVWASLEGGLGAVKDLTLACARYRFRGRVRMVSARERSSRQELFSELGRAEVAADDFRVRSLVERFIERGQFLTALSVVDAEPLLRERRAFFTWIKALEAVRGCLGGAGNPDPRAFPWLDPLVAHRCIRAFRLALRVESALRNEEFGEAARLSVGLIESAMLDVLARKFPGSLIDESDGTVWFPAESPPPKDWIGTDPTSRELAWLYPSEGQSQLYRYDTMGKRRLTALKLLDEPSLRRLNKATLCEIDNLTPRDVRNQLSHGDAHVSLTDARIVEVFEGAELWRSRSILGSPLTVAVLVSLGVEQPERIFDDLIGGLMSALRDYSY